MTFARKILALSMCGALLGSTLAVAVPPASAFAQVLPGDGEQKCTCNDDPVSGGSYKCNSGQTACVAGSEKCTVTCS